MDIEIILSKKRAAEKNLNWLLDRGATTDQIVKAEIDLFQVIEELEEARLNGNVELQNYQEGC